MPTIETSVHLKGKESFWSLKSNFQSKKILRPQIKIYRNLANRKDLVLLFSLESWNFASRVVHFFHFPWKCDKKRAQSNSLWLIVLQAEYNLDGIILCVMQD